MGIGNTKEIDYIEGSGTEIEVENMNIELKENECAVVIRAEGGDVFVSDSSGPLAERSRYLLAVALHALRAEEDDAELWGLLERRISIRSDEYEASRKLPSFRVIQGGLNSLPED